RTAYRFVLPRAVCLATGQKANSRHGRRSRLVPQVRGDPENELRVCIWDHPHKGSARTVPCCDTKCKIASLLNAACEPRSRLRRKVQEGQKARQRQEFFRSPPQSCWDGSETLSPKPLSPRSKQ